MINFGIYLFTRKPKLDVLRNKSLTKTNEICYTTTHMLQIEKQPSREISRFVATFLNSCFLYKDHYDLDKE